MAAEAAAASPLLDDINLAGARGILVNVTAGMDMSIGEFEEVGNIIKEYASEEATVVVGTVIDADMSDELRVTVVATGLDQPRQVQQAPKADNIEFIHRKPAAEPAPKEPEAPAVPMTGTDGEMVDLPPAAAANNMAYLDIPAFLRRQTRAAEAE